MTMFLPMAIVPAVTNLFLSYRRFMVMLIPVVIMIGVWSHLDSRRRVMVKIGCIVGVSFQLFLLMRHLTGEWAG